MSTPCTDTTDTTLCAQDKTRCAHLPSSSGAGNGSGGGVRVTETQNKHNCQHATQTEATTADTAHR
jgi:hypothetical protein